MVKELRTNFFDMFLRTQLDRLAVDTDGIKFFDSPAGQICGGAALREKFGKEIAATIAGEVAQNLDTPDMSDLAQLA